MFEKLNHNTAAQTAFKLLFERTVDDGTKDSDGNDLPSLDLKDGETFDVPYFEQNFCKPSGYVALNRSFFSEKPSSDAEQFKHAKDNSAKGADLETVKDMIQLQKLMHKIVGDVANSKLTMLVLARAQKQEVLLGGRVATTEKDLQKVWRDDVPTEVLAGKFYNIYYSVKDEPRTWAQLIFAVARDLKIWCPVEDENLDYCPRGMKGKGPKAHALAMIISNKFRDNHRNPCFRNSPHGISLTVSLGKRQGRRPKVFIFDKNVTGWRSEKHKEFVRKSVSISAELRDCWAQLCLIFVLCMQT